jgi:hypothetical protein
VDLRATVCPEGLGQLRKKSTALSIIEPETSRVVAQCNKFILRGAKIWSSLNLNVYNESHLMIGGTIL